MAGIQIHASNDLEALADSLAGLLGEADVDPFVAQPVVVQSLGVQRWLTWRLSRTRGICAGVKFSNPKKFINQCLGAGVNEWEPEPLAWRLLKLMRTCRSEAGHEEIARYLGEEDDYDPKAFGLAVRLANLFDQYLVYRPTLIESWREGRDLDWQGRLWQALQADIGGDDPALFRLNYLQSTNTNAEASPVYCFGLGLLPPEYLRVIRAAAQAREVHLFILQPTEHVWADLLTLRGEARLEDTNELPGHPLLVSMGRQGREFHDLLLEENDEYDHNYFAAPTGDSVLSQLQGDVYAVDYTPNTTREISANDASIQLHACHSPLREVEVLHDELLRLFEINPELKPHDVVVMTPDIEGYAPFLRAVFDNPGEDSPRIPFTIADRHPRHSSGLIDAFLSLLEMRDHTLPVTDVLTRLETGAVRRRFGLNTADLERLHQRCLAARIHWGYDGAHRESLGLPDEAQNTWRFGLDRMLLGYAMQAEGDETCEGILPLPGVEGDTAVAVGALADFVGALRQLSDGLQEKYTLDEWACWLEEDVLERFFKPDHSESNDEQQIRQAISKLRALQAHCADPVPLAPVREQLLATLEKAVTHDGFLRGSVTCCALKPLRSIPFRVICLLGMNDGAFPRADSRDAFNRMLFERQKGDRSARDDDRYLFLETVLAAREVLYLSYQGQSLQDDTKFPPSVLVGELLDALDASFQFPKGAARKQLVRTHRLQAFSPAYFDGSREDLVSYSAANAEAAGVFRKREKSPTLFLPEPLPEPVPELRNITVDDLLLFFKNPARWFIQKRLGVFVRFDGDLLSDTEHFVVDGLEKYSLEHRLLNLHTDMPPESEWGAEKFHDVLLAEGILPHGPAGEAALREHRGAITGFTAQLRDKTLLPQPGQSVDVEIELNGFKIRGQLDRFSKEAQLCLRPATIKGPDLLQAWIRHLVWHLQPGATPAPAQTVVAGMDGAKLDQKTLLPPKDAAQHIADLLNLFWQGQRLPWPLFPKSSYEFALVNKANAGKAEEKQKDPLNAARKKWEGEENSSISFPEKDDPYLDLCFRHTDPLADDEFAKAAQRVFEPVLEHIEVPKKTAKK
jgi:exodeoxyribonuclease V gamma subunit